MIRFIKRAVARGFSALGYNIVSRTIDPADRQLVNAYYRGHCFRCFRGDAQCEYILTGKGWDNQLDDILREIDDANGGDVIEVGANIGGSLVPRAAEHPGLRFHCVEPVPEFFDVLTANVQSYAPPNVTLYNEAVGAGDRESIRIYTQLGTAGAVAAYDNHASVGAVDVRASTIDRLFPGLNVRLVKIDTDGFEHAILTGGRSVLTRCRPLIFMEFHVSLMRKAGTAPERTIELLRDLGYADATIWTNEGALLRERASLEELLQCATTAEYYVDVLLRPAGSRT